MKLSKISVKNYRRFESFEMNFHPELTVVAARNGQGKTTTLEAIAAAFGPFVGAFDMGKAEHIRRTDARLGIVGNDFENEPNFPVKIDAELDSPNISWQRALNTPKGRTTTKEAAPISNFGKTLQEKLRSDDNVNLPVVAYYPSSRLWLTHKDSTHKAALSGSRTMGYEDCLSSASSFRQMQKWLSDATRAAQQQTEYLGYEKSNLKLRLKGIETAVDEVMAKENWSNFHFSFSHNELAMWHPDHGLLPVSLLSDGVRAMISLTADLAFRCARLNGHLKEFAPKRTEGIVLIDEVDLHLHPSWQQNVIKSLRDAFPKVQFIVTTHSPQVLSTVSRESIRVIFQDQDNCWRSITPDEEVKGMESAMALNNVMGVNPIPPIKEADWVANYIEMIENGTHESDCGMKLRQKLLEFYGTHHPVILNSDRLIRFQSFKQRQRSPKKD